MHFANCSETLEGIRDLENAILRLQRELETVSQELFIGGSEDDRILCKRLKYDLRSLLGTVFPKMCRLLASVSGNLRQLTEPDKGKDVSQVKVKEGVPKVNVKVTEVDEDETWKEIEISPDTDVIKFKEEDDVDDDANVDTRLGDDWDACQEDPLDTEGEDIQEEAQTMLDPLHIEESLTPVVSRKQTPRKQGVTSRIPDEMIGGTSNVKHEQKRNWKFMSSCKDGKEIIPPSPYVLLMDDVDEKLRNIVARREEGVETLSERFRKRRSPKNLSNSKITNTGLVQDDNGEDSDLADEIKPEKNDSADSDFDAEKLLSDESDDLDQETNVSEQEDYEPPTKKSKKLSKTRRKRRTKSELLASEDYESKAKKLATMKKRRTRLEMTSADNQPKESICSVCSYSAQNVNKLKDHVFRKHPLAFFEQFGPKDVTVEEWMQSVNLLPDGTVDNENPYKCPVCGRPLLTRYRLTDHILTHDGSEAEKHQCDQCGKLLKTKLLLLRHSRQTHATESSIKCACCNTVFTSIQRLKQHEFRQKKLNLSGPNGKKTKETFVCSICNKSLSSRMVLDQHMGIHTGVKPFLCPHPGCGTRFRHMTSLSTHIEGMHSEVPKFVCTICGKKFNWRHSHAKHMRAHEGPKILCTMCPKMFMTPDNLNKHVRSVHSQSRPHVCHLCPKGFKERAHLKYHLKTHQNPSGRQRGLNRVKEDS